MRRPLRITLIAQLVRAMPCRAHVGRADAPAARVIRTLIQAALDKHKAPGAVCSIGIDSRIAWSEGFGYADSDHVRPRRRRPIGASIASR
jgi:hypothetical protein